MSTRAGPGTPDPGPPDRAAGVTRVIRTTARGTAVTASTIGRGVRAVVNARGAGESGLGRMVYLHLAATAADTIAVTALASTIFFAVPTQAARGRVALSLAITIIPFALLAPLIGPFLDRIPHGRRYALATTMVVRSFLAWVMASAVADPSSTGLGLYPAACGFLVCQKAYLVTRAAAVPRILPDGAELVSVNSRLSLAGVVAMVLSAPLGAGLTSLTGPVWTLRLAFAIFAGGTALALMLPSRVDASAEERAAAASETADSPATARLPGTPPAPRTASRPASRTVQRPGLGRRGTVALRGNAALRAFTGFFTLFLAFKLRSDPIGGLGPGTSVALVIAVFAIGNGAGTALGGLLRRIRPDVTVIAMTGLAAAVTGFSALAYGLWPVLAGAFTAGLAQGMAKLCLDAVIQSDVPESTRSSAFARSETVLQLAWVAGGGIGLILPLPGPWGLGLAAVLTAIATVMSTRRPRWSDPQIVR